MLDKVTYALLKKIYKTGQMTKEEADSFTNHDESTGAHNKHISFLLENHLISRIERGQIPDGEGGFTSTTLFYKISISGRAFIEQKRRDLFYFWMPYTLTTIVAIAGLLVAIAGLQRNDPSDKNPGTQGPSHSQVQTYDLDISDK